MFGGYASYNPATGKPAVAEGTITIKVRWMQDYHPYCDLVVNDSIVNTFRNVPDAIDGAKYLYAAILKTHTAVTLDTTDVESKK